MTDPEALYAQLLARADDWLDVVLSPQPFAEAVRVVLKLHAPVESTSGPLQCVECAAQCHSGSGLSCDYPDAEYPCATVKAIASALGVDHG